MPLISDILTQLLFYCLYYCCIDVLRECRADNARLMSFLSRPEIVMDLVRTTFDLPPLVGPARLDATGLQKSATSTETPQPVSVREQQKEHHLKHAHAASELLTSDNKRLSEAVVSSDLVMAKVFSYLEDAPPGQLNTGVAAYFSKLIVSLLKTHNTETTQQMAKRGQKLISSLLKHVDSAAIADLIVRVLDSPDSDHPYNGPPVNKKPTPEALDLFANADILGGLADCFVRASTDALETALLNDNPSALRNDLTSETLSSSSSGAPASPDMLLGKHPLDRKLSERPTQKQRSQDASSSNSAASNISPSSSKESEKSHRSTELSGTSKSSPDANAVMSEVSEDPPPSAAASEPLAKSSSPTRSAQADEEARARRRRLREETMANVAATILGLTERMLQLPELDCDIPERLSVFESPVVLARLLDAGIYARCNGALDAPYPPPAQAADDTSHAHRVEAFTAGCNSALMHALGLSASLLTTESNIFRDEEEDHAIRGGHRMSPNEPTSAQSHRFQSERKDGDKIVSTNKLEAELAARFERLAQMLDENESEDSVGIRPLGSLRLKLAEFFVACIKQTGQDTVQRITALGVPKTLLHLFSRYRWSSMLHGVVASSVIACLEGGVVRRPGRTAWFDAGLIPWLIEVWFSNNTDGETVPRWGCCGYMGHLIRIGTALRTFLAEHEGDEESGYPDKGQAERFRSFSEQTLIPALDREAKPLCDENGVGNGGAGGDGEDGEEATDVLDMGGIQFVEGLSRDGSRDIGLRGTDDDEGEIKPVDTGFDDDIRTVEVDDLDHFGADDDNDVEKIITVDVDHDMPSDMRRKFEALASTRESSMALDESRFGESNRSSNTECDSTGEANSGFVRKKGERNKIVEGTHHNNFQQSENRDTEIVFSQSMDRNVRNELHDVDVDSVDSSSEDEGSYVEFLDDRKEEKTNHDEVKRTPDKSGRRDTETSNLANQVQKMRVDDDMAPSALEGVVTEIEEEGENVEGDCNPDLSGLTDDDGNSSDEDYEAWEESARTLSSRERENKPVVSASMPSSGMSDAQRTVASNRQNSTRTLISGSETHHDPKLRQV